MVGMMKTGFSISDPSNCLVCPGPRCFAEWTLSTHRYWLCPASPPTAYLNPAHPCSKSNCISFVPPHSNPPGLENFRASYIMLPHWQQETEVGWLMLTSWWRCDELRAVFSDCALASMDSMACLTSLARSTSRHQKLHWSRSATILNIQFISYQISSHEICTLSQIHHCHAKRSVS